jgi:hypothetical protein
MKIVMKNNNKGERIALQNRKITMSIKENFSKV